MVAAATEPGAGEKERKGGEGEGGRPMEVEQRECKYSQRQRLKQSAN